MFKYAPKPVATGVAPSSLPAVAPAAASQARAAGSTAGAESREKVRFGMLGNWPTFVYSGH